MVIRKISPNRIQSITEKITKRGKRLPLSYQYDVDIKVNESNYILRVQMMKKHNIVALHAVRWWYEPTGACYQMVSKDKYLLSLLTLLMNKYSDEETYIDGENTDISNAVSILMGAEKRAELEEPSDENED